jgi:hyperosmotically inducible protein
MKAAMWIGTAVAAVALVGCGRNDDSRTAIDQPRNDSVIAQTEPRENTVPQSGMDTTPDTATTPTDTTPGSDARSTIGDQIDRAADAVGDAAITAEVNAALARDDELSALSINVDTSNGQVVLHGTAPTEQARERATALASAVKGVVGVENNLTLKPAQ